MDTTKKIGRYEIIEELGRGAMGTVYRAKDPAMDRIVALKTIISLVLASEKGSEFRERFYREARASGALAHPGIVTVFDVGEHEGVPFLVMEFIRGRTLADAVKQGERLSIDRVCEIGQQIAEALGHAHKHGVVHRDIKPANIMLTSRETYGVERPKITDFGVAKMAEGQTTLTGQLVGTPAFMPPEQFTGAPIDGRADIFSLGVVLYWMATGEQPFPGESMTSVSYKVVNTDPIPPRKLNPSIPAGLEGIILKCLAKSPDDRYQTGEALSRELGEMRSGVKPVHLSAATGPAAAPPLDPDATYVEPARTAPRTKTTIDVQKPVIADAPKGKSNSSFILAGLAAVLIVAGGWYAFRSKGQPAVQDKAPVTVAATETQPTPAPAVHEPKPATAVNTAPAVAKATDSSTKKSENKVAPPETARAPKAEMAARAPEPVDFNPKSLDPKANARLKIDADKVPATLDFTVELNGKLYMRRSAEGNKAQYEDMFVPPGVQEFRVTAASGGVEKASNIVSAEFKAKKKNTLKIELRMQGMPPGSGVPQDLYPNTQLVVSLK